MAKNKFIRDRIFFGILAIFLSCDSSGHSDHSGDVFRDLCNLGSSQASFKKAFWIDQNNNAIGEYAFLQELLGLESIRKCKKQMSFSSYKWEPSGKYTITNGIVTSLWSGYNYYVYVPGDEKAIGESKEIKKSTGKCVEYQEKFWICYAWPHSGKGRVFAVNQTGWVCYFQNSNRRYFGYYQIPQADAALSIYGKNPQNLDAPMGMPTCDGEEWIPIE